MLLYVDTDASKQRLAEELQKQQEVKNKKSKKKEKDHGSAD